MRILIYVDRRPSPDESALLDRLRHAGHAVAFRNGRAFKDTELEPADQIYPGVFERVRNAYSDAGKAVFTDTEDENGTDAKPKDADAEDTTDARKPRRRRE